MPKSIQDLRELRAALAKKLHDLMDSHQDDWKPEHGEQYDAWLTEIDDVDAQIKRIEDYNQRVVDEHLDAAVDEAADRRTRGQGGEARALFARWLRGGDNALNAEEWARVRATLSTGTGSEGGYTVQTEVAQEIIDSLKAFGGVREAATVIVTEMGNPLSFPTSDGTSEVGELIPENQTATAADPTFGTVALNAYKFSSKIVAVPFELLQDSQVDIEAFIRNRLVQRIGRITNTYFTTGTGTAQPGGVAAKASSGKVGVTGQTTTVIFDDLVDLIHSVDPAYRMGGSPRFMMHDSSLKVVRKLKDDQSRPVFLPGFDGLGNAMPDTILGYPVTINQDVATMAANAKSILFGDFSKYVVRDVMEASLFRFTDSAYAKLGQVGFLMWSRAGGNLLDTAAVKYYQNSAT